MKVYVEEVESPAGPLVLAVDEVEALLWLQLTDGNYERTIEQELEREGFEAEREPARTARAREELMEYCVGGRRVFSLPLAMVGTEWQKAVWESLMRIPFGETRSYAEVAAMSGRPKAARAVGRANATNRLPLVVPCHRVIGADGSLSGFTGGTHLKTRLLEHEARMLAGTEHP